MADTDEIRTARLLLRRARVEDLADIHSVMSDPAVMRFWSTLPHDDIEQTRVWLNAMIGADAQNSDDYVIQLGGRVIGKIGCFILPEIGFQIASDLWGQGLASEAMAAYLARRRIIGDPSRIVADVDPRNGASLALLKSHGFVETGRATGTWKVGDEVCDSIYLALDL
jgi:RimJ/RimL family protein N-acetyltransferase